MARYILGRIAGLAFTLLMVSIITFGIMHAVPGGPFDEMKQPLPPAAKANILRKYGLDKPLPVQYARYMWAALHFDFGTPFQSPTETVTGLIARVWPVTLVLAAIVIVLSYTFGLLFGIVAGNKSKHVDRSRSDGILHLGHCRAQFCRRYLAHSDFQRQAPLVAHRWMGKYSASLSCLSSSTRLFYMALVARYTRVNMLEALRADYVRTAGQRV